MKKIFSLNCIGILLITFLAYIPALKAGFTNWDDDTHLLKNPSVRSINIDNIKYIFSNTVSKVYIPLTILSFAVEYHFFRYWPFIYHLNNLLLHLLATTLVYLFLKKLRAPPFSITAATLIFGLHPMHVESVAWITESKDVLFTVFYLSALLSYIKFIERNQYRFFVITWILGLLSICSKAMAISLPLMLLLLDWFMERKKRKTFLLLEKLPFLIYILPIAYLTQSLNPETLSSHENLLNAGLIFVWTFAFYILKFFIPYPLIPLYTTPEPITLSNPIYLLSLFILVIFIDFMIKSWKNRWVMFGLVFYLGTIFFLFRFNPMANLNVVADRFIYLPSIGLCLLSGLFLNRIQNKKTIFTALMTGFIMLLVILTFIQNRIWTNSLTLWNHQLKFSPNSLYGYNNRGYFYQEQGSLDAALNDYNRALQIDPTFAQTYNNRGTLYAERKQYKLAQNDYYNAILLNAFPYSDAYHNLGILFLELKNYDAALVNINKAIEIYSDFDNAYNTRGAYYDELNQPEQAIADFTTALSINPGNTISLNNRGVLYAKIGKYDLAEKDLMRSLVIDPNYVDPYLNLAHVRKDLGDIKGAIPYLNQALQINPKLPEALNNRGLANAYLNNFEAALKDFEQLKTIDPQSTDTYINRGTILLNQKRYLEAIENYTEGIGIAPDNMFLFLNRGAAYLMNHQEDQAIKDFSTVIQHDPEQPSAYYYRAFCHINLKNYPEALKDAQAAQQRNFPNADQLIAEINKLNGSKLTQ